MAKVNLKDVIEKLSITPEEKAQLDAAVKETLEAATKAANEKVSALETELETVNAELASKAEELSISTGIVPGTYTSKRSKKTVQFKKGVLKFTFNDGKGPNEYESAQAIKNSELMEQLIALEVGFLEEVED